MARTQTLVQLSERLVAMLDQRAASRGMSRSQLIREAIEAHLAEDLDALTTSRIIDGYARIPQAMPDAWGSPTKDAAAMARTAFERLDAEERAAGADPW